MGSLALPNPVTTVEYLEQEAAAAARSEYVDGIVYAMSGGTFRHSILGANTILSLGSQLKGSKCRVATSDLKVWIPTAKTFYYPDVLVICETPRYYPQRTDIIENPKVIVEVLSDSTENYDRGQKFRRYRSIPELRQYVLVSQNEALVEVYTRDDQGFWILREYDGLESIAILDSVNARLPLHDLYDGVDFEAVIE